MSTESILEDSKDVRFKVPVNNIPYSTIVRLSIIKHSPSGNYGGTGFLAAISSQLVIITAGHCLQRASSVTITWPDHTEHLVRDDRFDSNEMPDYGIILLRDDQVPVILKDHPILLVPYKPSIEDQHSLFISGYPGKIYGEENKRNQYGVFLVEPKMRESGATYLLHTDPTSKGMSGGPVFYKFGHHNYAIGIHIRGFKSDKDMEEYLMEVQPEDNNSNENPEQKPRLAGVQPTEEYDETIRRHNTALLLTKDIISKLRDMLVELQKGQPGKQEEGKTKPCKECLEMCMKKLNFND